MTNARTSTSRTTSRTLSASFVPGVPLAAGLLAAGLLGSLAGCVGYTTYPAASWQLASDEMNGPPADEVMIEAVTSPGNTSLAWVEMSTSARSQWHSAEATAGSAPAIVRTMWMQ